MQEYIAVLKKYAVFNGRASRREYWMFQLYNFGVSVLLAIVGIMLLGWSDTNSSSGNVLGNLYSLAVLLPSYGVAIRRMHDINKSGWWILVPIYSLILAVTAGDKGPNNHGPDPYAEESTPTPTAV